MNQRIDQPNNQIQEVLDAKAHSIDLPDVVRASFDMASQFTEDEFFLFGSTARKCILGDENPEFNDFDFLGNFDAQKVIEYFGDDVIKVYDHFRTVKVKWNGFAVDFIARPDAVTALRNSDISLSLDKTVHDWCGVWVQDLGEINEKNGGWGYDGILVVNPYNKKVYMVKSGLWEKYRELNGPCGVMGVPKDTKGHYTENDTAHQNTKPFDKTLQGSKFQEFEISSYKSQKIYWYKSDNKDYTFAVYADISTQYQAFGGDSTTNLLGLPIDRRHAKGEGCSDVAYNEFAKGFIFEGNPYWSTYINASTGKLDASYVWSMKKYKSDGTEDGKFEGDQRKLRICGYQQVVRKGKNEITDVDAMSKIYEYAVDIDGSWFGHHERVPLENSSLNLNGFEHAFDALYAYGIKKQGGYNRFTTVGGDEFSDSGFAKQFQDSCYPGIWYPTGQSNQLNHFSINPIIGYSYPFNFAIKEFVKRHESDALWDINNKRETGNIEGNWQDYLLGIYGAYMGKSESLDWNFSPELAKRFTNDYLKPKSTSDHLKDLKQVKDDGLLSDEDYDFFKKMIENPKCEVGDEDKELYKEFGIIL